MMSLGSEAATGEFATALRRAQALGEDALSVCAYRDGELLVEGGTQPAGAHFDAPLFPIFSVTKAVTALAVHIQAERGLLSLSDPVARHWPEFAAHGKDAITIGHVLVHRAGVPYAPVGLTPERLGDWEWITSAVADLVPADPPGVRNSYHSLNFGWILGEVVRRSDGDRRPFGRFVLEEINAPLGITNLWLGLPEDQLSRVVPLKDDGGLPNPPDDAPPARALPRRVALAPEVFNRPDVLTACIPAVGGVADARSVARLFALLANEGTLDGVRLLSSERVRACLPSRPDAGAVDLTYGRVLPVGLGGFWVASPTVTRTGAAVLAHPGAGGSVGWADLDRRIGAAICHNRMFGAPAEYPFKPIAEAIDATANMEELR